MKQIKTILTGALVLLTTIPSWCQQPTIQSRDTLNFKLYFQQDSSALDLSYRNNDAELKTLQERLKQIRTEENTIIEGITVTTYSSPDGNFEYNRRLSERRAASIQNLIKENLEEYTPNIAVLAGGENWEGLRRETMKSKDRFDESTLETLNEINIDITVNAAQSNGLKSKLVSNDNGKDWETMKTDILPDLRIADGKVMLAVSETKPRTVKEPTEDIATTMTAQEPSVPEAVAEPEFITARYVRFPVMAIRSNLLVPLMNIGAEVCINDRWSLESDFYSPWISRALMNRMTNYYENCFQVQALYLQGRYWLGNTVPADKTNRLCGHSIGFGLGGFHYDIGQNYKGQQGDGLALGADYTYAVPVGKGNVHFEFSVGICCYYRTYRNYRILNMENDKGETIQSDKLYGDGPRNNQISVAPFKAAVSVVVPIFKKEESK